MKEIGYIKKFSHSCDLHYFDGLADKIMPNGVLAICKLINGCKHCEELMLIIESMVRDPEKRPSNLIIIWGLKNSLLAHSDRKSPRSSADLKDVRHTLVNEFNWDYIDKPHGFALASNSRNFSAYTEDHSPKLFAKQIKNLFRRLNSNYFTINQSDYYKTLEESKKNGLIVNYDNSILDSDIAKFENQLKVIISRLRIPVFFFLTNYNKIEYVQDGKKIYEQDDMELSKLVKYFKRSVGNPITRVFA